MTRFSLDVIQDKILQEMDDRFAQKIVEQTIPDSETVLRDDRGNVIPYISIQFGDIRRGRSKNMATVRGDDYILPLYVQAIAPDPTACRKIYNKVIREMVGLKLPYAGVITKSSWGAMWTIANSTNATEAYMYPCSFSVLIQLIDGVE